MIIEKGVTLSGELVQTSGLRRRVAVLVLSVAVGGALMLACTCGSARATAGTPGIPQAPATVYFENFQNVPGAASNASQLITSYTSTTGTTYTASPSWLQTSNCNGIVADALTTSAQACPTATYTGFGAGLMHAMGIENGSPNALTNYGLLDITRLNNLGTDTTLLQTVNGVSTAQPLNGRFVTFGIVMAATTCSAAQPDVAISLVNNGQALSTGSGINPCTDPRGRISPVTTSGGGQIRVGTYFTPGSVLVGSTGQLGFIVNNLQTNGGGNDLAFDDVRILDGTPQLDKSFSPATVENGSTSTLTFTITNTNDLAAKDGWSFSDDLPSGLSVASPSGASTTCSGTTVTANSGAGSVSATGNLNQGQVSCTITVKVTSPVSGTFTNGPANVTETGLNPPGSASVTFQGADLQISKTASPQTAVPGTNETYTLIVKNNGPATAAAATVSDPLPASLSFVSASQGCAFASGKVTCAAGDLAAGASKTFTVVAKVASSDTARITNTATASSPTPDPDSSNNTSTAITPVGPQANLQLLKTASLSSLSAGGQITYTLVANNNGPSDATGVTVSDPLPAGETLVSATPSQGSCTATKCQLGTIVDGGSAQIQVTVTTAGTDNGAERNTASVIGNNPDPDPSNNSDGSTVVVTQPPAPPAPRQPVSDLQVVKSVNHRRAYPGQRLTYTLIVTNHGPAAAANTKITDTSRLSLKAITAKPSQGSCHAGRPITCALGTIASGKHATITVTAKVMRAGSEKNTASATSGSKDPTPPNNLASARTTLKPVLRLRKTATPKTVRAGATITYHLKVANPTSVAIKSVKVCDALPLGLSFRSASPKAKLARGKECWTTRSLSAGKSRMFTVHVRVLKGTSGTKTNHATVTGKGAVGASAKARVHVKPAPKPKPTPVTG